MRTNETHQNGKTDNFVSLGFNCLISKEFLPSLFDASNMRLLMGGTAFLNAVSYWRLKPNRTKVNSKRSRVDPFQKL